MSRIATISGTGPILASGESTISVGGGFIGALFSGCFVQLFSLIGTIIVSVVIGIVGLILMFEIPQEMVLSYVVVPSSAGLADTFSP